MEPQAGTIEVGAIMEGKVTSITNFGAFVDLGNRRFGNRQHLCQQRARLFGRGAERESSRAVGGQRENQPLD